MSIDYTDNEDEELDEEDDSDPDAKTPEELALEKEFAEAVKAAHKDGGWVHSHMSC
jgi:hypothetical protein